MNTTEEESECHSGEVLSQSKCTNTSHLRTRRYTLANVTWKKTQKNNRHSTRKETNKKQMRWGRSAQDRQRGTDREIRKGQRGKGSLIKASLKAKNKGGKGQTKNTINEKVRVRNTATTVVVQDITPVTVGVQSDLHKLDLLHRLLASVSRQRSSEPAISDASTSVITSQVQSCTHW